MVYVIPCTSVAVLVLFVAVNFYTDLLICIKIIF